MEREVVIAVPCTVGIGVMVISHGDKAEDVAIAKDQLADALRKAERELDRKYGLVIEDVDFHSVEVLEYQ